MPLLLHDDPPFDDDDFTGKYVTSFEELTDDDLDTPPTPAEEGEDWQMQTVKDGLAATSTNMLMTKAVPVRVRVVEHHRDVKYRMRGKDVVALKRALARLGFFPKRKKRTAYFGGTLNKSLKKFQRSKGLTADGVYGKKTHEALVKAGGFDKWGSYLMAHAPLAETPAETKRRAIVAYWTWAYHNRGSIYYLQRRPMHIRNLYELPTWEDCSEYVTRGYKAGGASDPNGFGYNGAGYTGTLANHGHQTWNAIPGDVNLYGRRFSGYSHTTGQVTPQSSSDLCLSMGNSAGPLLLRRRYRFDYAETRSYL